MADISVSVVIDCYNHERFVDEAIESALGQGGTGGRLEVVVVDDGSTDATAERARRHGPAVRVIRQENQGQAQAFNTGIRATSGDIVCFLDGDDVWYPDKVAKVVREFQEHPEAGFVQHPLQAVDAAGRLLWRTPSPPPAEVTLEHILDGCSVIVGTSGLSIRRRTLDKIMPVPKDLTTCADEYVSKHALFFGPGRTLPENLGGLRLHGGNSFQGTNWKPQKLEAILRMIDRLDAHFDRRLAEEGRAYTPVGRRARLIERKTKEILLRGWRGQRAAALAEWNALRRELPITPFSFFKSATLLVAAFSPRAYLTMQTFYGEAAWLPALRRAVLRERAR